MEYKFGTKHEAAKLLGYHPDTLTRKRKERWLVENIHYVRINARVVRYNLTLIQDLIINAQDPQAHQLAINRYIGYANANQKLKSKRR